MDESALDQFIVDLIKRDRVVVPPFPAVASQLTAVVSRDDFELEDLAHIVSREQVLAATVLRHANSARFGAGRQVNALKDAILRLGADELYRVAWSASLGRSVRPGGPLAQLEELLWRQSVSSAFLCFELARMRGVNAQQAFTSGLIHRLGRAVALECLNQALAASGPQSALAPHKWVRLVDQYEVELGLVMTERWALPSILSEVIARHRKPELASVEARPLAEVVAASDEIVALLEVHSAVSKQQLEQTRHLGGPEEIARVEAFLSSLPELMAALLEPPQEYRHRPESSRYIERPPTTLEGPLVSASLPTVLLGRTDQIDIVVEGIAPAGCVMQVDRPQQENSLLRMRFLPENQDSFEVWGVVSLCVERPGGDYLVEARLFGLDDATKVRWTALVRRIRIDAVQQ